MWVKLKNGNYVSPETGASWDARDTEGGPAVRLTVPTAARGLPQVVEDGYASMGEARAALDDLMTQLEYVQAQPPVVAEETDQLALEMGGE